MSLHQKLIEFLASRPVRLHHFLWHQTRDTWNWNTTKDWQRKELEKLCWAPPRPSQDSRNRWQTLNGSGEDFLFMHRQMIAVARKITNQHATDEEKKASLEALDGWGRVPRPGNNQWPVPLAWEVYGSDGFNRFLQAIKADSYYWLLMREWERTYTDASWLKGKSLGTVGTIVESTIHNMMHMRWCDRPWDPRTRKQEQTTGRPDASIDEIWDNAQYNWLGDPYSSHINPTFWKLHGWVDNLINDWFEANKNCISEKELGGVVWYEGDLIDAKDPWPGGMDFGHNHSPEDMERMQKAAQVVLGFESFYHFYDV